MPLIPASSAFTSPIDQYLRLKKDRLSGFRDYRLMDDESPDASSALNVYADNAVYGDSDDELFRVEVENSTPQIAKVIEDVEVATGIRDKLWGIARDLAKYGEDFEEVLVHAVRGLVGLKFLPPQTMWLDLDEYGKSRDPDAHFVQRNEADAVLASWPEECVIHFKLEGDRDTAYGRSVLKPARRKFRQLQMVDDAMVIARSRRANMRYVYQVDTGTIGGTERFKLLDDFKKRHRQKRMVDPANGNLRNEEQPLRVEDDIYVSTKDDVKSLAGDSNVSNIKDVEHLHTSYLTALGVPKAFLGREQDVNGKATLTEQRIQFVRRVRGIQTALRAGLKKFYQIAMIARGIDPSDHAVDVIFPSMSATDEMVYWQTLQIKVAVATAMRATKMFSDDWIYQHVFELTPEQIEQMAEELAAQAAEQPALPVVPQVPAIDAPAAPKRIGPAPGVEDVAALARDNPEVKEAFEDLHWMLESKLNQLKAKALPAKPARRTARVHRDAEF